MAERRDPADARMIPQHVDLCLRQHAAVADQHQVFQIVQPPQFINLVSHRPGVPGVARIGLHRQRPPVAVRQDAVDHDRPPALAVAAVTETHQRTGGALVVTA